MKAYGNSFSIIRNNYLYEIPFFQRRYVWEEGNWKELLESMSAADDCPFLGSIILKENTDSEGNIFWTVIDGQQRLTTLSILMRACFDELTTIKDTDRFRSEYDDEDPWSEEVRTPFNETTHIKDSNKDRHTKIRHSRIDHIDFEKVMDGGLKDTYKNIDLTNTSKIIQCYCYFRKALKEKGIDTVLIIWDYLTKRIEDRDENGKYLVIIELDNKENEQAIFDTVNTAGVRLTCADTIKNTLFQHYIDVLRDCGVESDRSQIKATKFYDEQWDSIFSASQDSINYWNKSRQVGRLYRDNIEILLHCIAVIKGFFDPAEKKMSDLPQCYKDYISELSCSDLETFIKEINTYAKLYQDNFEEVESKALYCYDSEQYLSRIMHIVDVLEISTFLPYILYLLFEKEQDSQTDVKERFLALERYLILHAICGETTKNYNKECLQLIKGTSIDTLLSGCENINSDKYEYGLRHMNSNKLATLLLFWVELYKRDKTNADLKKLPYTFSLEHIMPQKWEEYWSLQVLPIYNEEGKLEDEEKAKLIRTDAIYQIGNMTLLNGKLNASLRNYDFARKVNGEGRKRGMKDLADCMITREIIKLTTWKESTIIDRTAALSAIISQIWGLSFA
ncbi:MAG: DUF262 domain-containing protein [Ruminococcus albus]|nr:DUF262 domain-containing protein [Ruminococcus albus]